MARHSSVSLPEEKSTARNRKSPGMDESLEIRARLLISNRSIPGQTRNLIQYALEIKDRHLAQIVRRVEGGEMTIDDIEPE